VRFIDTKVFIRYLVEDDPEKARQSFELMIEIEAGRQEAAICEAVITEAVYVLRSKRSYGWTSQEIADRLAPLLSMPALRVPNRGACLRALELIAAHPFLDMEDALCTAHMERLEIVEIYSFDEDFDRVASVRRVTPGSD
jgi:predicted nucleic acid-binding protein